MASSHGERGVQTQRELCASVTRLVEGNHPLLVLLDAVAMLVSGRLEHEVTRARLTHSGEKLHGGVPNKSCHQ